MLMLNCANCDTLIYPSMMLRGDAGSCLAHCPNKDCGAIYRIGIVLLKAGSPVSDKTHFNVYANGHQEPIKMPILYQQEPKKDDGSK